MVTIIINHDSPSELEVADYLNDVATAIRDGNIKGRDWELKSDESDELPG